MSQKSSPRNNTTTTGRAVSMQLYSQLSGASVQLESCACASGSTCSSTQRSSTRRHHRHHRRSAPPSRPSSLFPRQQRWHFLSSYRHLQAQRRRGAGGAPRAAAASRAATPRASAAPACAFSTALARFLCLWSVLLRPRTPSRAPASLLLRKSPSPLPSPCPSSPFSVGKLNGRNRFCFCISPVQSDGPF